MNKTKIDYLDECINIICGCTNGCWYCWAKNRYAPRFKRFCKDCGNFIPHFHEERLKLIDRIKKPSIVGLNFMGDTWGEGTEPKWRMKIWDRTFVKQQHQFILLTKQPQEIKDTDYYFVNSNNLWVGVSMDDTNQMDRWIALSQKEYIRHKIISFEPLLSPLWGNVLGLMDRYGYPDWIIIGALTKSDKVSMAESREAVKKTIDNIKYIKLKGVKLPPIFVKDNAGLKNVPKEYPKQLQHN